MSYKVASLEHTKKEVTTQILQEYFVPITQLEPFVQKLKCLTQKHGVNLLNVSIRHVPADKESLMAYARQESFALVMFITMENNQRSYARLESYTRELINAALSLNGTYYLPYVPFARVDQFKKAYPAYKELQKLKKEYDPENRFSNTFLNYYLT